MTVAWPTVPLAVACAVIAGCGESDAEDEGDGGIGLNRSIELGAAVQQAGVAFKEDVDAAGYDFPPFFRKCIVEELSARIPDDLAAELADRTATAEPELETSEPAKVIVASIMEPLTDAGEVCTDRFPLPSIAEQWPSYLDEVAARDVPAA